MTTVLEGGEWSAARPSRTLPPGKTRYPFYRRLGGPQGRSGRAENLVPTGIRSRTVQLVAQSLYRLSYPARLNCTALILIKTNLIINLPIPLAARSKAWFYGRLLARIAGSNPAGCMDVCLLWMLGVVRKRSLWRTDRLSRGVIPSVVCLRMMEEPYRECLGSLDLSSHEKIYWLLFSVCWTFS